MSKLIELQSQIKMLQEQAEAIKSKEFETTVKDILAKMTAFGITPKDLAKATAKPGRGRKAKTDAVAKVPKAKKTGGAKVTVAAKFKGPNGELWSGRGLTPKWLATLVATGHSKEEFLVPIQAAETITVS